MRKFILVFALLFFVGCSFKPSFDEPKAEFKSKINMVKCLEQDGKDCKENENEEEVKFDKEWWKIFNDKKLNAIVEKALKNNTDLRTAYLNFEKAAANLGIERSDLLPKLDASASAARAKTPKNMSATGEKYHTNSFSLGLNLSYELDLWGKYRDAWGAAGKGYEASIYDFESARLSVISNVVKLYFNAVSLNNQVEILSQTVEDYTTSYELKSTQHRVGAISEYELYNYKAQMESAKAQLVSMRASRDANAQALMILVSSDLNEILYATTQYTKIEDFKVELPQGISSKILAQRPDIRAALARLEQQNYLVGVARTAYLPSISLTGLLGFQSLELGKLLQGNSVAWNAGASAVVPIFRWGETTYNVNLTKLAKDEAYLNYESTLKTAFGEVRTALIQRESAFLNEKNYKDLLESQEKIFNLAEIRYSNGSSSLEDLITARQSYLNAKLNYENSVYALLSSVVDIIKAFGGGFNAEDDNEAIIKQNARKLDMKFRD